ncbi:MAG: hypothetical protein ACI9G1_001022 [Pirellulaceae bacterium]|jgi:hypothetical protein
MAPKSLWLAMYLELQLGDAFFDLPTSFDFTCGRATVATFVIVGTQELLREIG